MARAWNDEAESLMLDMPPVFYEDPTMRALQYCHAMEAARIEDALATLRRELNPLTATDYGIALYERTLQMTVRPEGMTLEQRREQVLGALQRVNLGAGENDWVIAVTKIVGPGWTYEEHDPADGGSPPAYTVRITLPFGPSGDLYDRLERAIREATPAHIDIVLTGGEGFILDQSEMDQEALTY